MKVSYKILYHLVIIFILFDKYNCNNINIISSDIIEKSSNLLGVELNYAYLNIELDSELIKYDTLACENYECPIDNTIVTENGIDCSCDYTDVDDCPKKLAPECGGKICPEYASDGKTSMCNDSWVKIQNGEQKVVNTLNGEIKQFRYKANATICESLLVVVYPIVGYFRGNAGGTPISSLKRNLPYEHVQTYNIMNICPTDNQPYTNIISFTQDTYFITIEPLGPNVTFSIQIYSYETNSTIPADSTCQKVLDDAKCIINGKSITDEIKGPAFNYYTFQVKESNYYYFSAPALYQDINLFISDDPSLPYPTISNSKWQSAEEYDDYLMIYLEPINSTHPLTIYIGVYCSYQTNFTLTVTSNGYRIPVNISSLPVNAGAYALTKSSRLILPDNTTYSCPSWYLCFPYSIQYPLIDSSSLWPVSTLFFNDETFRNINFENSFINNPFKSKSYQSSVLLSLLQSDSTNPHIYQTLDIILNSKIEFLSTLFNSVGKPLNGIYSFKKRELVCNYEQFQKVLDAVKSTEEVLFSVSDLDELNNWRYRLDSLTFRDDWIACLNEAKSLLDTQEIKKNISSIFCPFSSNDPKYALDPCCNASLAFFQCCNPKQVEIIESQFIGTHDNLINSQCSSFECTQSVLSDFYKSISSVDSCSVSSFKTQNLKSTVTQILRDCKKDTFKYCNSDSDCQDFSSKTCDIFTSNCLVSFETFDKNYINCVLENIPPSTLYGLVQISSSNITNSIINSLYESNQQDDCISESSYPLRQMMIYTSDNIPNGRCYPSSKCLDQSCELEHDVCFDQVYTNFKEYEWLDLNTCESIGFCPAIINDCGSVDFDESLCSQQCNSLTSFCGHCSSNETYCHQITEYNDQPSCETKSACLLPSGQYILDITKEECESSQNGVCTGYCGYSCGNDLGCIIESAKTETQCQSYSNSQWLSNDDICLFNTDNSTLCSINSYKWLDCSSETVGQCSDFCSFTPILCSNENDCISNGGECSDLYYFLQENTVNYPNGLGKCVRGHFEYRGGWYPSCNFENENDSPMGCFEHIPKYKTKSSCELVPGNKWFSPSINKDQCISQMGCKTLDLNSDNLDFNFRFNQMSEELCTNCYQSHNKWTNMFEWTPSIWIKGVYVENLNWIQNNKFKIIAKNKKAFSYQSFYTNIMNVVNTQIADLLRSESFCKLERIQSNLNSITCSCTSSNSTSNPEYCFKSSVPLLGQTKPCFGESSIFEFGYGQLEFKPNSIIYGCSSILVSQLAKENYMAAVPESLSSNFVNYNVIDKYGVLNEKNAIVGILLLDGINIKAQFSNIKSLTVCFKIPYTSSSDYSTFDFATTNENEKPYPLNTNIFKLELNETSSNGHALILLCSNVTQKDFNLASNEIILFPIVRLSNWENQSRQVFNKSTRGLIFSLATLYLLVSLWGIYQIGYIIRRQIVSGVFKVQLVHILIFIVTVFILMRSIYFYVLGNGHFAFNPVGDYIMVILPTFLYFTAFTIIVVLFYVLVYLSYRTGDASKRIFKMVLLINIVIYLLFIACTLVFKKSQNIPKNDCGSRIIVPIVSSIPQRAISITYAIVQFVISIVIGASFVYLGTTLYLIMRRTKKALSQSANNDAYNRIFLQTSICSIGFILHCIFILILVTGRLNTIAFSFTCLIITEIIPTIVLLYCYNPKNKNPKKEISMNTSHNNSSDS